MTQVEFDLKRYQQEQRALLILFVYRLMLCGVLLMLIYGGFRLKIGGPQDLALFAVTSFGYLGLVGLSGLVFYKEWLSPVNQALAMFLADAIAIPLLIHGGGGATAALGILLASSIALTSLLVRGQTVLFLAAIATFAVFSIEIYSSGSLGFDSRAYSRGGLLGSVYFAIALLAVTLSRRIRESEYLAEQRAREVADLARLNEQIIQQMATGVVVSSTGGRISYFNQAARLLLDISGNKPETLLLAHPQLERLRLRWLHEPEFTDHQMVETAQCQLRAQFRRGGIGDTCLLIFLEDASEAMQQARQIKLASLGRLTAGIAHQIRNPLSSINHASQLLAESAAIGEDDRRLTEIIRHNALRVNGIIESILQLSRRQEARQEALHLAAWLTSFSQDFDGRHGLDWNPISLHIEPGAGSAQVLVDVMQLDQVLDNLCDNALRHGGRESGLEIRLRLLRGPERTLLQVADNGNGLSETARDRLFEPFFTTRSDGTGLGLYIARELCEANGITLSPLPCDRGTCFQLAFRQDAP